MGDVTHAELISNLRYEPETGTFYRHKSGEVAGNIRPDGYVAIRIGSNYRGYAHKLAWFYVHGVMPETDIDHINLNPSDNRLSNLRLANRSQNMHNTVIPPHNTSGFKGVCYDKVNCKWMAHIHVKGKFKNLGRFLTKEEAAEAYNLAAVNLFGNFARVNHIQSA